MGTIRTTYLIDEEGTIIKAMGKVKAANNPAQMLEALSCSSIRKGVELFYANVPSTCSQVLRRWHRPDNIA